jgi:hypothetical protein
LSYDIPRISAISLAVSPSIFFIIGNYTINLENCHVLVKITIQSFSKTLKKNKIFLLSRENYIDIFSQVCEN